MSPDGYSGRESVARPIRARGASEAGNLRIVVAEPIDDAGLARARSIAPAARWDVITQFGPDEDVDAEVAASAVVLFSDVAPANAERMTRLRWMQLGSHGYGQLRGVVLPAGIEVCNASGVGDIPIAEWCVMMMLALRRNLPGMLADQRAHHWNRAAAYQAELRGRRVGILGYGNIGQELARQCRAMGLEVWVLSRFRPGGRELRYHPCPGEVPVPDRTYGLDRRQEFYAGIDVLVVTTPITSATRGLVDAAALAALPSHAVLLNPARAGVVDEAALLDALRSGRLAGAALDDHYRTPMPPDDPFWDLPNVIVSPHVSGSTGSTHFRRRIWDLFTDNLQRFLAGAPLLNRIPTVDLELAGSR